MVAGQRTAANSISVVPPSDFANFIVLDQGDLISSGLATYPVKRLPVSVGASGDNPIITAASGKMLRMLALTIVAQGGVEFYLKNATNGPIFGGDTYKITLSAAIPYTLPPTAYGWCQTGTVSEALVMNLSSAVPVAGSIVYAEVQP